MLLTETNKNQKVRVAAIHDPSLRLRLLQFGIQEGDTVHILEKITHGPMVLHHHLQEIALGNEHSKQIEVMLVSP
ncbi:ferrous iron transport protein A [Candidatus Woesearchaeota archaeon]|nr:ferrous iron transport protein A [Candidatus Woesearchaeota archaeon]